MGADRSPDAAVDDAFDALMANADSAMIALTVAVGDERSGCLVGFHCQASINPRQYAVWLSKANHTYDVAVQAETYAVHFLRGTDRDLAVLFGTATGDEVDKFDRVPWTAGPNGVPLLDACPNRLVLRRHALVDAGGDHVCLIGDVLEAVGADDDRPGEPLRLSAVDDLEPGHDADEQRHRDD